MPTAAQQPAPAVKLATLLQQAIADLPGREIIVLTIDIPPCGASPAHRHPGHYVFGYMLEGSYKLKLDQAAETALSKGQTFYEAPGQLHAVSANASQTDPAKILAFMDGRARQADHCARAPVTTGAVTCRKSAIQDRFQPTVYP